jgi:secondary thiamine-phosphate synthase enzyme
MKQYQHRLNISATGRGFYNITREIQAWVAELDIQTGMLNVFVQHTSCSLIVQENADPDVLRDMEMFMSRLVVDGDPEFLHRDEGDDDMSAHIRMALTQVSLNIPIMKGQLGLGLWQAIYLYEHRTHALNRQVQLHLLGE